MKYVILLALLCTTGCALFQRKVEEPVKVAEEIKPPEPIKRTTRRSLEEESMLGESSGSLWSNRGQSAFLFSNNNQRLLGDLLNVNVDGYPKEQIQLKVNTLAKMLASILNDQRQEIKAKDEEWQKKNAPPAPKAVEPTAPGEQADVKMRAPASAPSATAKTEEPKMNPENEKALRAVEEEADEVKQLQGAKEFPIRSVPTRITDINKDGSYVVKGSKPFMIGKREYKLEISGVVKPENFDDKGVSAEALLEPEFNVVSEKKSEDL